MENPTPVLVTLTAPSAAGKSYLFNYIRDVAKLPCLISTTTRAPRSGEVEGVDYHFITEEQSKQIEAGGGFAELAIFNGNRYGVTQHEFHTKLQQGIAFLIVEPTGIEHYVKPALDAGALHYNAFVFVDPDTRYERFVKRARQDMREALDSAGQEFSNLNTNVMKVFNSYLSRQKIALTEETKWFEMHQWDRVLMGDAGPEENLKIILKDIQQLRLKHHESKNL